MVSCLESFFYCSPSSCGISLGSAQCELCFGAVACKIALCHAAFGAALILSNSANWQVRHWHCWAARLEAAAIRKLARELLNSHGHEAKTPRGAFLQAVCAKIHWPLTGRQLVGKSVGLKAGGKAALGASATCLYLVHSNTLL